MPSRTPGNRPDPAAELLGRWQAHHEGNPDPSMADQSPEEHPADAGDPSGRAGSPEQAEQVEEPESTDVAEPVAPRPASPARQPRHAAPRSAKPARGADQTEAAREVIEALGIPAPPDPTPTPAAPRRRVSAPPTLSQSTDVEFPPRLLVRRVLGLLLLALVPATAGAGYLAYDDPTTLTVGVAGTLLVATLAIYAVRVTSTPAHLAIHSGQLEVVRGNHRDVFDLTSRFTRMEVVGRPGRPGWKVLMARFGRDPLVIDSSMVDPASFTAALERHRPHAT